MRIRGANWFLVCALLTSAALQGRAAGNHVGTERVPENVYHGELVNFPGAWSFQIGKSGIILVSDKELIALADPDKKLNLAMGFDKQETTLRQVCERAKAAGQRTLIFAFDQFFSQYRPGQNGPRKLTPDMDEYVQRIAGISKFAHGYGLGLELSLLSPLEIGTGYTKQTGESGLWLHYRKGYRDPKSGRFSVSLWQQKRWGNNKGIIEVRDAGVRVFAFHETAVPGTLYHAVDPASIMEITDASKVERLSQTEVGAAAARIRVYGKGRLDAGDRDRVLIVQQYKTPEMDYFSPQALPFLKKLVDKYADAGVKLNGLYSDEMHIQADWNYFGHHDNGEFALRYVSPGLQKRYAELYGGQYSDFAKYMVYFVHGQEDYSNNVGAKDGAMEVFGATADAVRQTALFRARYYRLLQDGVVDLFVQAKRHAEDRMGYRLESRAHATWAESPTIDKWNTGHSPMFRSSYEYTSNFVWSNTVQQAAAACDDYFRWGDFLTGNGNDHAEGGWMDRDYYALALACSTGILNEIPYSYAAHWGMPDELSRRRYNLVNTYGDAGSPLFGAVQDMQHRDVSVLMLYPIDLVAVEERFGSWMTQYGYANMVTQGMLLERGKVVDGAIELGGRRFTTLAATFEPFASKRLLTMMSDLVKGGGRVIWSGPPPSFSFEGEPVLAAWEDLFGTDYQPTTDEGWMAPGKQVEFSGILAGLPPQVILTDFLVDRIYPATPRAGTQIAASVKGETVATYRAATGGGSFTFLGFRPRDDQSRSLGVEARWWFDILNRLGAYPPSGRFADVDDNTEAVSRSTDYLACRFPNGSVAICRHLRDLEEGWGGGFARNQKEDEALMKRLHLPSEALDLHDFKVNGHAVTFTGGQSVCFRTDPEGRLIAFSGCQCRTITIDGKETVFADHDMPGIAWAPVPAARRAQGGAVLQIMAYGACTLRIPAVDLPATPQIFAEGATPGSRGEKVACHVEGGELVVTVTGSASGHWLYVTP